MSNAAYMVEPHYEYSYSLDREELEQMIVSERLYLYNRNMQCGAKALKNRLEQWGIENVPALSTINKILHKNCLTNNRTGYYPGDYEQ